MYNWFKATNSLEKVSKILNNTIMIISTMYFLSNKNAVFTNVNHYSILDASRCKCFVWDSIGYKYMCV